MLAMDQEKWSRYDCPNCSLRYKCALGEAVCPHNALSSPIGGFTDDIIMEADLNPIQEKIAGRDYEIHNNESNPHRLTKNQLWQMDYLAEAKAFEYMGLPEATLESLLQIVIIC